MFWPLIKDFLLDCFLTHSPRPALALPCRILMAQKVLRHWQLACVKGVRMLHGSVFKCFLFVCLFFYVFIYLFMAVLGLCFCARAFSSCGKWGPLFIAVCGPLTVATSLVVEHRLQTRRLSNCGSRAQPLRGMWDPPRPGLEPVSPALAGRFSATAPPGKPSSSVFDLASPLGNLRVCTLNRNRSYNYSCIRMVCTL